MKTCPVCGGKGFLLDEEPETYFDHRGNEQIRFKKSEMPCPMKCKDGFIEE